MEGLFIVFIIWLAFSALTKGAKRAAGNNKGQNPRDGAARPNPAAPPRMPARPLTPAARPGEGPAGWSEIMTMLSGRENPSGASQPMEGVSTEGTGSPGSLTGPSLMEGSPLMMDESGPDYEGASLPGESSADVVAMLPKSEQSVPVIRPALSAGRSAAALRDAVVWAEILDRPKALRARRAVL